MPTTENRLMPAKITGHRASSPVSDPRMQLRYHRCVFESPCACERTEGAPSYSNVTFALARRESFPSARGRASELSGEIEGLGSAVTKFKLGDAVFAFPGFDMGAHAEY